jgi:hypothetical protein
MSPDHHAVTLGTAFLGGRFRRRRCLSVQLKLKTAARSSELRQPNLIPESRWMLSPSPLSEILSRTSRRVDRARRPVRQSHRPTRRRAAAGLLRQQDELLLLAEAAR